MLVKLGVGSTSALFGAPAPNDRSVVPELPPALLEAALATPLGEATAEAGVTTEPWLMPWSVLLPPEPLAALLVSRKASSIELAVATVGAEALLEVEPVLALPALLPLFAELADGMVVPLAD